MPENYADMIKLNNELENKQTKADMNIELIVKNSSYIYSCNFSVIDAIQ